MLFTEYDYCVVAKQSRQFFVVVVVLVCAVGFFSIGYYLGFVLLRLGLAYHQLF